MPLAPSGLKAREAPSRLVIYRVLDLERAPLTVEERKEAAVAPRRREDTTAHGEHANAAWAHSAQLIPQLDVVTIVVIQVVDDAVEPLIANVAKGNIALRVAAAVCWPVCEVHVCDARSLQQ